MISKGSGKADPGLQVRLHAPRYCRHHRCAASHDRLAPTPLHKPHLCSQGCQQYFLPGMFDDGRSGRGAMGLDWEKLGGKFAVVAAMLAVLHAETNDRVVIVSNYTQARAPQIAMAETSAILRYGRFDECSYTLHASRVQSQTLDLFGELCRQKGYPFVRLDGGTGQGKRQKLVVAFNDPVQQQFVFLLSSKAGGCGINLVGGNRLILFDPDWCD